MSIECATCGDSGIALRAPLWLGWRRADIRRWIDHVGQVHRFPADSPEVVPVRCTCRAGVRRDLKRYG